MSHSKASFAYDLICTFLSSNIHMDKLRTPEMKNLLEKYELPSVSQSYGQSLVKKIAEENIVKIKEIIKNKHIFVIIDESSIKGNKYINVLIGTLLNPQKTYLVETHVTTESVNNILITQVINDTMHSMNIHKNNLILIISDAARYMTKATDTLKILFPNVLHITCVLHLLHNCALKIKSAYPSIDNLISSLKAATVKNKYRRDKFSHIGFPPIPVVTRWGTWLEAVNYYSNNFKDVVEIINSLEGDGILLRKCKEAITHETLVDDILAVTRCYGKLLEIINNFKNNYVKIKEGYDQIINLSFREDPLKIGQYIQKKLGSNEISEIVTNYENINLSLNIINLLFDAPATSISVERSFSLLGKMLQNDRPFNDENIKYYIISLYNKTAIVHSVSSNEENIGDELEEVLEDLLPE